MDRGMSYLFLLSSVVAVSLQSSAVTPKEKAGPPSYGNMVRRRSSIAPMDPSNDAKYQSSRKKRGLITGIITAVALGTSAASAVVNSLGCKHLHPGHKAEIALTAKVVDRYNSVVLKWRATAKDMEKKYAIAKNIHGRVEWIHQMEEDMEKNIISIIGNVLAEKVDPDNVVAIDADNWKPDKKTLIEYLVQNGISLVSIGGHLYRLNHQIYHGMGPGKIFGGKGKFVNKEGAFRYRHFSYKTKFVDAYKIFKGLTLKKGVLYNPIGYNVKGSWKVLHKGMRKAGISALAIAGLGYDIYSLVDKFEGCKKSKSKLKRQRTEYEEGIRKMHFDISKFNDKIRDYERTYTAHVEVLQQENFTKVLGVVETLFKTVAYIPSLRDGDSIEKIDSLSKQIHPDISQSASNEIIVNDWVDLLKIYKKDIACLKSQEDAIDQMIKQCKKGAADSLHKLYQVSRASIQHQCGTKSIWSASNVTRRVAKQVTRAGGNQDCRFNNPHLLKSLCNNWFQGGSFEDIAEEEEIGVQKVRSMVQQCKKKNLTVTVAKAICWSKKRYGDSLQRLVRKYERKFKKADITAAYSSC